MIKRLVLENWRSHEKSEFIFSKGTNVLIGRMGSGKSSTMDAICFALFGTFSSLQSKKLKLDDCIMNKPKEKDKARVVLDLEKDGDIFTIVREITRGRGTTFAEIRKNGEVIEGGNATRVTEIVENILGINYDLFSKAIYSEQNNVDYFLQIPRGKRKQKIDELLGIDNFELARKNLVSIKNRIRDRIKDRENELESLKKPELEKKIDEIRLELEELGKDIVRAEQEIKKLEEENRKIERKLIELENTRNKTQEIKTQQGKVKSKLETLKERVEDYEEKYSKFLDQDLNQKLKILMEKFGSVSGMLDAIKKKENELEKMISEKRSQKMKAEDASKSIQKWESEIEKIVEDLKKLQNVGKEMEEKRQQLEEKRDVVAKIRTKLESLSERKKQLEGAEGKCPVCERPLEEHKKEELILHVEREEKELEENEKKLKEMIKELEEDLKRLENDQKRLSLLEGRKEELEKRISEAKQAIEKMDEIKATLVELEKKKAELENKEKEVVVERDKLVNLKAKLERLIEIQEDYKKSKQSILSLENELAELEKEIRSLKFDQNEYDDVKRKNIELVSRISSLKTDVEAKMKLKLEKERLLEEVRKTLDRYKELENEISTFKKIVEDINILISSLESGQVELREEFTDAVNAALQDIWPRLYPYDDYKSVRLWVDEKDYLLQLQRRDGKWVNVEGIASGGERTTAALALRVAFALVLAQNLSWLILDEPTHNLDKEGVLMLAKTLKEHLPSLVDQIFIITHDEDMEEAVSGTLYKLERKKGLDEPTRATLISSGGA